MDEDNVEKQVIVIEQMDFSLIRSGSLFAIKTYGDGFIPVSNYKIQSSADGETELCIIIKAIDCELELKASLKQ